MSNIERFSIECDGVFDLSSALGLEETLALVKPGGKVEVDLSRVREFHDAGLAVLARTIQRAGATHDLDVRGLRERHLRLLRYLGVELHDDPRHRRGQHDQRS
jgi:ABC-type transporter Mla MlaB component